MVVSLSSSLLLQEPQRIRNPQAELTVDTTQENKGSTQFGVSDLIDRMAIYRQSFRELCSMLMER
jgi:hypothetical protein